jgi:hypothetical protein
MGRFFTKVPSDGVKGERRLFVLNHARMSKLQQFVVQRSFFGPAENFSPGHSLFMPCYNFLNGKTHGYLIAVCIEEKWRLGVLQHVELRQDDMVKIAHIAVFKDGTTWPQIKLKLAMGFNGHSRLMRYLQGETLEDPEIIPLVEISRRDSEKDPAIHQCIFKDKQCFHQPECPDFFLTLSHNDFQKLFGHSKEVFDIGMKMKNGFVKEPLYSTYEVQSKKRSHSSTPFDLIETTARAMKKWCIIDRHDIEDDFHVYYVVPQNSPSSTKGKVFLAPKLDSEGGYSHNGEITFYQISNKHKEKLMIDSGYTSVKAYNQKLSTLSHGTTSMLEIDPSKHQRGFIFSMLQKGTSCRGRKIFSNHSLSIYHEKKENVLFDCDIDGAVMFRGFPWCYDNSRMKEEHLTCLEEMHGSLSGMIKSRKSVDMTGFFSYTGPRATSQSSCSPNEPVSKGHDLYTKKNCPLTYPLGVRLARMLCMQSDNVISMSGNVMMKAAMIANHLGNNTNWDNDDDDDDDDDDDEKNKNNDYDDIYDDIDDDDYDDNNKKNDDDDDDDDDDDGNHDDDDGNHDDNDGNHDDIGFLHNMNSYQKICHNRIITKWFASVS